MKQVIECPEDKNNCNENLVKLAKSLLFCYSTSSAVTYDGGEMLYCPWCGAELVECNKEYKAR